MSKYDKSFIESTLNAVLDSYKKLKADVFNCCNLWAKKYVKRNENRGSRGGPKSAECKNVQFIKNAKRQQRTKLHSKIML